MILYDIQSKMESRIRASISSLRGQSAWSPMPEHLLFAQLNQDKSPTPITSDGENKCEECGMNFKSEAMLTYHKVGFCIGPPTDEILLQEIQTETSFGLTEESKDVPNDRKNSLQHSAKNTTLPESSRINKQKPSKLEWCMCAHGAVAPSAIKVGYDDSDQTYTYLCVAQIGDEVIPGTVLPPRKHATVLCRGSEIKATDYSVLTDLQGLATWKRCEIAGAIPRDAIRGGYDSDKLQYFIARGKAPDGNWCCGQYIPHKQQCFFAWEGNEYKTNVFEILCKTKTKEYFSNTDTKVNKLEERILTKPRQATETALKEEKVLIRDSTGRMIPTTKILTDNDTNGTKKQENPADIRTGYLRDKDNSTSKPNKEDTSFITLRNTNTPEKGKSGTEVKTQAKFDETVSHELKEKSKIINSRELTKSGVSRENGVAKEKSKLISKREITKSDAINEHDITKEKSKLANQHNISKEKSKIVSQHDISKEKSKIVSQHDISEEKSKIVSKEKSKIVNRKDISKEKSKIVNQRELTTPRVSKENLSKEKSRIENSRELTRSGVSRENGVKKERSKIINRRELITPRASNEFLKDNSSIDNQRK